MPVQEQVCRRAPLTADRRGQGVQHSRGDGPFPAELHDEDGERLRSEGGEFGATTGDRDGVAGSTV